jgi:hypothetical protein
VHPTKSQEKWQIKLEKEIVKEDWHIIYSIPFTTLFMGIAFSKPLYRYSKKFEIMPYLFGNCSKLRNPPSFYQ